MRFTVRTIHLTPLRWAGVLLIAWLIGCGFGWYSVEVWSAYARVESRQRGQLVEPGTSSEQGASEVTTHHRKATTPTPTPRGVLHKLADRAAVLCGVPATLFRRLIEAESSWNPRAESRSGALGLAQVKLSTARGINPRLTRRDLLEPFQGALYGACYLRTLYDAEGTWRAALRSYHAGPNRLTTPPETHAYAEKIAGEE